MNAPSASMRVLGSRDVSGVLAVDDVGGLLDQLRPLPARTDPLLVVAPETDASRARHTLSLARAGAPGATGVVHASSLPPLARRGLVEVLGSMSAGLSAGQLLVAAEAVEGAMVAGAVLASVTRLAAPAPHMSQHLASWWPTTRFVVLTHPAAQIVRTSPGWAERLRLAVDDAPLHFAATAADATSQIAVDEIAQRLTGRAATVVATPDESRSRWGTPRFAEFSAVPQDVSALVTAALEAARPCRSCGAPVAWPACRFCHAARGDR